MTSVSRDMSEKLAFWSIFFSVSVVVIHCAWTAETAVGRLLVALFRDTLARLAVPFFFACSGFFLARHFDEAGWWRREAGKRLLSLVVPYVIWTLALAAVLAVEAHERMGLGGFGLDLRKMPALAPLWYVRCLLVFVFVSPVLRRVLDRSPRLTLTVSYGALLGLSFALLAGRLTDADGWGGFLCYGFSLEGLFYFLGGMYVCRFRPDVPSRQTGVGLLLGSSALIVLRLWVVHRGVSTGIDLRCLITPLTLVGLLTALRTPSLPGFLGGCAFPIYLLHGVVLAVLRYWGGRYQTCNPWLELLAGVIAPVVVCNLLRRAAPGVASRLFGNRVSR